MRAVWGRQEPGSKTRKGELGAMRGDGLSRQSLRRCFPARGNRAAPALKKGASQKQAGKHEETPALKGKGRSTRHEGTNPWGGGHHPWGGGQCEKTGLAVMKG